MLTLTMDEIRILLDAWEDTLPASERFPDYTAVGGAKAFLDWLEGKE